MNGHRPPIGKACSNAVRSFGLLRPDSAQPSPPVSETVRLNLTAGRYIRILQCHDTYTRLGSGGIHLAPRCGVSDPLVSQIVLSIAKEIPGGFLDHILVESLNTALAVQLTRLCGDPTHAALTLSNGLSRERLP